MNESPREERAGFGGARDVAPGQGAKLKATVTGRTTNDFHVYKNG